MLGRHVKRVAFPLSGLFTLISMGKLFSLKAFLALHGAFRNVTPRISENPLYFVVC